MDDNSKAANTARWVGYELHDGLLQWLVGARMSLEASMDASLDGAHVPKSTVQSTLNSLVAAIDEGRSLITYLERHSHEQVDVDLSLIVQETMQQHTLEANAPNIRIDTDRRIILPQAIAWHILRIAQQAVRNALTHAKATEIIVQVHQLEKCVHILVQDDGIGFSREQPSTPGHFGLASMQQRADALDASLDIRSAPGEGTSVELTVTLEEQP